MNSLALQLSFSATVPTQEGEIEALARSLQLAQGFSVILVRCNLPA